MKEWSGVGILLISQKRLLTDALVATLQGVDGQRPCIGFSHETVEAALVASTPNMVIIDASHPDATALVAAVRARVPTISVIVLAARDADEDFLAWADIGISGYLGLDTSADDLLSATRRVRAGEVACPRRLTALLLNRFAGRSNERTTKTGISTLTTREGEIAGLLADGLSNKLIARRLACALATVKNHVHSILEKWECQSRGEVAAQYRQRTQENAAPSGSATLVELPPIRNLTESRAPSHSGSMQDRTAVTPSRKAA